MESLPKKPEPPLVLVVDDDEDIREVLCYNLRREGYRTAAAEDGEAAFKAVAGERPSLIILDLMMPKIDGLALTRILRASPETQRLPILMLTARGEEADIVAGLELGADDYIVKPFSLKVLLARVSALLRRAGPTGEIASHQGRIVIDVEKHTVAVDGGEINLTATEFKILQVLKRRAGRVLTRTQIVDAARGEDYAVTDRSVDVHIVSLRKKLGAACDLVETIRGIGYRLKDE